MSTRSSWIKAMVRDSYPYFLEQYDSVEAVYSQIFDVQATNAPYEQFTSAIGPGSLTKVREGVSIPRQTAQEGYTVYGTPFKYPTEQALTNEAINDNQKIANFLKTWAGGLGEVTRVQKESDHADVFNYGGFTAGHSTFDQSIPGVLTPSYKNFLYDAKPFFALTGNNHPAKNGSTYYNSIASLTLSGPNLETICKLISITNAKNEAGIEVTIMPDTLLVQQNSANWYKALRILESMGDQQETHSGIKNVWKNALRPIGWRFLTNADAWFVGCAKKGLKSLDRMAPKIDYYEDQNVDSQIVRMRVRWGKTPTNFRYWVGANLSTS